MLATPATPGEVAGPDWAHEFKWDGVRALVASDGERVQVRSRAGNDITDGYPELRPLAERLPAGTVLDGEIVAFGRDGAPSFPLLQRRMHVRDLTKVRALAAEVPADLIVFDVLAIGGEWLLDHDYESRRARLMELGLDGDAWQTPASMDDLGTALRLAGERHLEGVVSKRRGSTYRLGERSKDWRKLRIVREDDFVVGGVRAGKGDRSNSFGALLLGVHDDRGLRFIGSVGSGFSGREGDRLAALLAERTRADPPFLDPPTGDDLTWVEPDLVVRVRYREVTPDHRLRQPSYRGQRPDVDPLTVRRPATPGV